MRGTLSSADSTSSPNSSAALALSCHKKGRKTTGKGEPLLCLCFVWLVWFRFPPVQKLTWLRLSVRRALGIMKKVSGMASSGRIMCPTVSTVPKFEKSHGTSARIPAASMKYAPSDLEMACSGGTSNRHVTCGLFQRSAARHNTASQRNTRSNTASQRNTRSKPGQSFGTLQAAHTRCSPSCLGTACSSAQPSA